MTSEWPVKLACCLFQSLSTSKRKLEQDLADLRGEAEDASTDARSMEDKARKSMLDAAKLADELRAEQEHAQAMEQDRKDMELRVHDIQVQLDEAEQNALKWGRKMIGKLENRIKELEGELDGEQRRLGDAM